MSNNYSRFAAFRSNVLFAGLLASASFGLSGCGGGDTASTPAPPSVTPPPAAPPQTGSLTPTTPTTFGTASAIFQATTTQSTGAVQAAEASQAAFGAATIKYDPASDTYTVNDASGAANDQRTFTSKDKGVVGDFSTYTQTNDTVQDILSVFNPTSSAARIQLSYVSYGFWSTTSCKCDTANRRDRFFAGGAVTDPANMPRTGNASYSGIVDGYAAIGGSAYRLMGSTGTFNADFGAGTVSSTLVLNGNTDLTNGLTGTNKALATISGTGSIGAGSSQFAGSYSGALPGSFNGSFFGPSAQEVGLSFVLQSAGGDTAAGVFVGKK